MRRPTSGFRLLRVLCLLALFGPAGCSDTGAPSDWPTILLLNPRVVTRGNAFGLYVYGENFGQGATVNWNGAPRPTEAVSSTILRAIILEPDVASEGTARITVSRPDGRVTQPRIFTIGFEYLGPAMTLISVTPEKGIVGSGDVEITATGTGFVPGTALILNGSPLGTTLLSSTSLRSVIPAANLQVIQQLGLRAGVPAFWATSALTWEVVAAAQ
jgi:hypothetical protein